MATGPSRPGVRAGHAAVVAAVVAAAVGCSSVVQAGAGVSAYVWRMNTTLEWVVDADFRDVVVATARALPDLDIDVVSRGIDTDEGEVEGRTAGGESVVVRARFEPGRNSRVAIRVGLLGDEALNWSIYRAIRSELLEDGRLATSVVAAGGPGG